MLKRYLIPNNPIKSVYPLLVWAGLSTLLWMVLKPTVFPNPLEVVQALPAQVDDGLFGELLSSLMVNVEAIILSVLVGLPIAYLSRVPGLMPLPLGLSKLRFVGPIVFYLPLTFLVGSTHTVKVLLITFGQLFYLVTSMVDVMQAIPQSRYDDAYTLNMSDWKSIWYVNVRGTVPEALDTIRANAAMGWGMIMSVESIIRSEGGIGVMMINQEKHVEWAALWVLILVTILVGVGQDWLLNRAKRVVCPYAS